MNVKKITKTHVICPHCNKVDGHTVDHIIEDNMSWFGPWYCEHCRKAYNGKYENGELTIEKHNDKIFDTIVFLKKDNVILAVKGMNFKSHIEQDYDQNHGNRYFYEEHTCPTNYLKNTLMIIDTDEDDDDPHGIFEYVGYIDAPQDEEEIDNKIWLHYINNIKKDN